jgi:hypothetical protein
MYLENMIMSVFVHDLKVLLHNVDPATPAPCIKWSITLLCSVHS